MAAGVSNRGCVWDQMGYHGTMWASMERAPSRAFEHKRIRRPGSNGSLTVSRLKEWLKGSHCPAVRRLPSFRNYSGFNGNIGGTRLLTRELFQHGEAPSH